ncbi:MAG: hypothetical protein WDZ59_09440 [Pirellulales bacterium]
MSEASPPAPATWTLQDTRAQYIAGELRGTVDLTSPRPGLSGLSLRGQSLPGSILQVAFDPAASDRSARLSDAYIRRSDLVATYTSTEACPFRTQIYWRAVADNAALTALDLIISVQTHLLDTRPVLQASISLPGELLRLREGGDGHFEPVECRSAADDADAPGCFLWRIAGSGLSFAGMIHPADRRSLHIERDGEQTRVRFSLFSCFLEKGVILRARLRGVFLPRESEDVAAVNWYRELVAAKPPLTT